MVSWGNFTEAIFDGVPTGVIVIDAEGKIADINRFAVTLFQIEKADWVGRSASEIFPELDMSLIRQASSEQVPRKIDELSVQTNGNELILSAEVVPLIALGQTAGTILAFQDRTEAFRIREEILQAEKIAAIGSMAAGTVHEIRNPLTTIKGFLQLFEKDVQKLSGLGLVQKSFSDKCSNIFPLLLSEIHKIEQILRDFLLISKPQEVRFKVLRINDLLNEVMPKLQEFALLHDVSILCEFPRKNLKFIGDPEELKCVIMNLVQNSLEAISGNGEIKLSVETLEESFRLTVVDNGSGIPEEQLSAIFDPFITTKPDRPGLGLSVCQQVIARMGGSISITSEPGKGTTARVEIPCLHEDILNLEQIRPNYPKETALR
ncbi:two-component system sensor histidine kinase NtrB [Effusibacillus consociatus]